MMLDALGVDPGSLRTDAESAQEILHDLVALAALAGEAQARLGQEHAAIGPLLDEPVGGEALQHLCDCRLRHAEALRDIDLAGFAAIGDQIGNELDIIFDQLGTPVMAGLAEALDMSIRIHQHAFGEDSGLLHLHLQFSAMPEKIIALAIRYSAP